MDLSMYVDLLCCLLILKPLRLPLQANHPRHDYRYAIAKKALVKNTLVSLPTGPGKTFIAAVVMYNFYRWFPSGKVIFVAPTRPLVMQQAQACYNIVGIPRGDSLNNPPNEQTNPMASKAISDFFLVYLEDTVTMTGQASPASRRESWCTKRVFFVPPQILYYDIRSGICDAHSIVCLVIDEAHRAQGNYTYCAIVSSVRHSFVLF